MDKTLSVDALIAQNLGLVVLTVIPLYRKFGSLTADDKEDLLSAGRLGLCRAAIAYRPERGVLFSSFAITGIRREVQKALERQILPSKANNAGFRLASMDAKNVTGQGGHGDDRETSRAIVERLRDETAINPEKFTVDTLYRAAFWPWVQKHLTPKQARALWLVFAEDGDGLGNERTAERLGIDANAVRQMVKRACQRLKDADGRDAAYRCA